MNKPKEIPMLFSTMMVQALLEGRKTITRRIIKEPDLQEEPGKFQYVGNSSQIEVPRPAKKYDTDIYYQFGMIRNNEPSWVVKSPYGKPGDIIWVRENWRIDSWDFEDTTCAIEYATGEVEEWLLRDENIGPFTADWLQDQLDKMKIKGVLEVVEKEDQEEDEIFYKRTDKSFPWKPSIHMPKEAARIWLKVKSIRVERLHDISVEDCIAEGIVSTQREHDAWMNIKDQFETLWRLINGDEYWFSNPFVWVVEFEVLSTTGKPKF